MEIDSPLQGQSEKPGVRHSTVMPGSQDLDKEPESQGDVNWDLRSRDNDLDRCFDIAQRNSSPALPSLRQRDSSNCQEPSLFLPTDEVLKDREKEEKFQNNRDEYSSLTPLNCAFLMDGDDKLFVNLNDGLGGISCSPGDEKAEEDSTQVKAQAGRDISSAHSPVGTHDAISGDSSNMGPIASQSGTLFNEPTSPGRKMEVGVVKAPDITSHVTTRDVLESAGSPPLESNSTSDSLDISRTIAVVEVFDEMPSQGSGSATDSSTTHDKGEEADLAALWEAALEDDELLEDDEQLSDPSSFFDDNGKDFLGNQPTEEVGSYPSVESISRSLVRKDEPLLEISPTDTRIKAHSPVSQGERAPDFQHRQLNLSLEYGAHQDLIGAYGPSSVIPALKTQISATPTYLAGPLGQQQHSLYAQTPSRPQMPNTAQSFSDKSKGGYTSPYDLPMELTRPKKRTHLQQVQTASDIHGPHHVYPPPRSSSIHAEVVPPMLASKTPKSIVSAGKSLLAVQDRREISATFSSHTVEVKPKTGTFFEQLPPKKRRPSGTRVTPVTLALQPNQIAESQLRRELPRDNSFTQLPAPSSSGRREPYQLLPPERLGLYAHVPHQEIVGQTLNSKTGYSPAPTRPASTNHPGLHRHAPNQESLSQAPAPTSRYSPAPARPASANLQGSSSYLESPNIRVPQRAIPQARSFSQSFDFIRPSDGREKDPLERWKGSPIFTFGFGGTSVSSFPKQIPRYPAGQTFPMIKCSPGEVKFHAGMVVPLDECVSSFPGPLKSKSKKKELLDWMQQRISQLADCEIIAANDSVKLDPRKRHEEKIILWKIIRILVEHDGVIEGNLGAISAVRCILSPEVAPAIITTNNTSLSSPHGPHQYHDGIRMFDRPHIASKSPNPEAIEALRKILLQGEQEKAVWYAADQRLWAHALLLASALHPDIWRQVIQEFIRQEIRTFGQNTESLASFYQVLARNWEESIDELVPPSARAGLPMVSGVERSGSSTNALDGLDRWRETLTLILSNRSQDDWKALLSLGQLLCSYGRIEAAHICFIFAKSSGLFGGVDDPQVSVALIGADHISHPLDYCRDLDSILLTEIYDFAITVLAPSQAKTFSPHLQSYKLYHALMLAEYGYRSEAQQYGDNIMSAFKSTTKISPFLHGLLYGVLGDLVERLRQAPTDDSASWISRPSMDKVSGSVWTRLNQFIAGDDSDTGSAASGKTIEPDISGPFAHVVGDSPSISQKASMSDIPNGYPAAETPTTKLAPNSRYAPEKQSTPRTSLDHAQTRSTQEPRREVVEGHKPSMAQPQYHPGDPSLIGMPQESSPSFYMPSPEHRGYIKSPAFSSKPHDSAPEHIPQPTLESNLDKAEPGLYDDDRQNYFQPVADTYSPPNTIQEPPILNHNSASFNETLSTDAYQPQTFNSYLPPSYTPDLGSREEFQEDENRLRVVGEDEDEQSVTATKSRLEMGKKRPDVDEAFRKAAEADGTFILRYLTFTDLAHFH